MSTKRARSAAMPGSSVVDMASFPKYEIVRKEEEKDEQRSVLCMHSVDSSSSAGMLEIGSVNPESNVLFARYDGQVYVGTSTHNPGSFAADGECLEQHTMGITLESLLALFACKSSTYLKTTPREGWNAGFKLLEAPHGHALRFRVFLSSPYAEMQAATFQDEFVMHVF